MAFWRGATLQRWEAGFKRRFLDLNGVWESLIAKAAAAE